MATDRNQVERIEREDLVMFINACFICTGQTEFYQDSGGQRVSIDFLHRYILGNYRRLYARTLAVGINHYNRVQIIVNLLEAGAPQDLEQRREEGELIQSTLRRLPTQRAYKALMLVRERGINNRRSRAVIRDYVNRRPGIAYDAVKYRSKVRALVVHAHLRLQDERATFLFDGWKTHHYRTWLFQQFREAHRHAEALYGLPFTVAEGLAAKHGIPRDQFLTRMKSNMTVQEQLRTEKNVQGQGMADHQADLSRISLTQLSAYVIGHPVAERDRQRQRFTEALTAATRRALQDYPLRLGYVVAVLDRSYSSSGSTQKQQRPLVVALAVSYMLRAASETYRSLWTLPIDDELFVTPYGQTNLADPLLVALRGRPDLVVIVSDGYENDPPFGVHEVTCLFRQRLDPQRHTSIIHVNPVFDADNYAPHSLSPLIPTVGLRRAEELLTVLGFARFADGSERLATLESYLAKQTRNWLRKSVETRTQEG